MYRHVGDYGMMVDSFDATTFLHEGQEVKRKSRNLSEKKRRDAFNLLIGDLRSMVTTGEHKLDKSHVLHKAIEFLKANLNAQLNCTSADDLESWKPSCVSNEEFAHLLLEANNAFLIAITVVGQILFTSQNVVQLLGYSSVSLQNKNIFEFLETNSRTDLRNFLTKLCFEKHHTEASTVTLNIKEAKHITQKAVLTGYIKTVALPAPVEALRPIPTETLCFIGTMQLLSGIPSAPSLFSVLPAEPLEFCTKHNMEWRIIYADYKVSTIVGYSSMDLLGTSAYDYVHIDDLDQVVAGQTELIKRGEHVSAPYRFITKSQQIVWLRSRYVITRCDWTGVDTSRHIVCTHTVVRNPAQEQGEKELLLWRGQVSLGSPAEKKASFSIDHPDPSGQAKHLRLDSTLYVKTEGSGVLETTCTPSGRLIIRPQPGVSIEHTPIPPTPSPRKSNLAAALEGTLRVEDRVRTSAVCPPEMQRMLFDLIKHRTDLEREIAERESQNQQLKVVLGALGALAPEASTMISSLTNKQPVPLGGAPQSPMPPAPGPK